MKAIFTILLIFSISVCQGQDITHNLSIKDAAKLLHSLQYGQPDSTSINSLIRLAEFNILKPGENKIDQDSAKRFLARALQLNSGLKSALYQGRIILAQAILCREEGQRENGKKGTEKAIAIFKSIYSSRDLGLAYYELSQYYDYTVPAEISIKLHYIKMAVEQFRRSGNTEMMAFGLKMLADIQNFNGESEQALKQIMGSLTAYQSIGYQQLREVYNLFGAIYFQKGNFLQALNYRLKALKTPASDQDTATQFCQINNGIGMTYMRLKDYRRANLYLQKALPVAEKIKDGSAVVALLFNIVQNYISLGEARNALTVINSTPSQYLNIKTGFEGFAVFIIYLEIHTSMGNFLQAQKYCNRLNYIVNLPETNNTYRNYIYIVLIKYAIVFKQYRLGTYYLKKNKLISDELQDPTEQVRNYNFWFRLDTLQKNYKSAVNHLLSQNRIADSVLRENQKKDLKQITTFYETTQKENALKLLQARSKLQQTQLQHAESIRKWIVGLAAVLLLLLIFVIDRYRVKQQVNRMLKTQFVETKIVNQSLVVERSDLLAQKDDLLSQKEWLLNEVHHRVKNNLHTVVCLLESQAVFLKNDALKAIEKSQNRIYALSLVHQNLYKDENIKTVDMGILVPELVRYLSDSLAVGSRIRFQLRVLPLKLDLTQAIPIALIINEAVSNAVQYAFPEKSNGTICIEAFQTGGTVVINIADNGIGMERSAIGLSQNSLGLKLIDGLSSDINATTEFKRDQGTKLTISFPVNGLHVDTGVTEPIEDLRL